MGQADRTRQDVRGRIDPGEVGTARIGMLKPGLQSKSLRHGADRRVREVMKQPVTTMPADATVLSAAQFMRDFDAGCLVVLRGSEPVGIVTDRDIVIRALAQGEGADRTRLEDAMSHPVLTCRDTQTVNEAAVIMADNQIRRLPVRDGSGRLVGMLSLDRIAEEYSEHLAGETLGEVVERR